MTLVTTKELPAEPPALAEQGQTVHADGDAIAVPPAGTQAAVLGDATLVPALLGAAAAWSGALARASVAWRVDVKPWPVRTRMAWQFAHVPADHAGPRQLRASEYHHKAGLDILDWLLLSFTAHLADVLVQRHASPSHTELTLEFLNTVNSTLEVAAAVLVEVLPAGQDCELSTAGGSPVTRQGIDALRHMLLPVLMLEVGRASTA